MKVHPLLACALLVVLTPLIAAQTGTAKPTGTVSDSQVDRNSSPGWLYPGSGAIVRFVADMKILGHPELFIPSQPTGIIILGKDSFSISVGNVADAELIEYRDGILKKDEFGLAQVHESKKMKLVDALATSLDEAVCNGLGELCRELYSGKDKRTIEPIQHLAPGENQLVLGHKRGAVMRIIRTWLGQRETTQKTCTFTVLIRAKS